MPRIIEAEFQPIELSWQDFVSRVRRDASSHARECFYRGQADISWPLASQLERLQLAIINAADQQKKTTTAEMLQVLRDSAAAITANEDKDLAKFVAVARCMEDIDSTNFEKMDWRVLARHHGLPSRLLDWTRSPYIAAYFSYHDVATAPETHNSFISNEIDAASQRVAVWQLARTDEINAVGELQFVDNARAGLRRQIAQKGLFTLNDSSNRHDLLSLLQQYQLQGAVKCFALPRNEVLDAMTDLQLMGITHSSLFPDLDGITQEIKTNTAISNLHMWQVLRRIFGNTFSVPRPTGLAIPLDDKN